PQSDETSSAYATAEAAYEGGRFIAGDVMKSAYLAHQWPRFANLFHARTPQGEGFAELVDSLYAPLFKAVKKP
ncbi:hypothetical protein, partial [Halomonas sp. 707D4]